MCENTTHQDRLNTLNILKELTSEEEHEKQNLKRIVSRNKNAKYMFTVRSHAFSPNHRRRLFSSIQLIKGRIETFRTNENGK